MGGWIPAWDGTIVTLGFRLIRPSYWGSNAGGTGEFAVKNLSEQKTKLSSTDKTCSSAMEICSLVLTDSHLSRGREGCSAALAEFKEKNYCGMGHKTVRTDLAACTGSFSYAGNTGGVEI